MPKKTKPKYVPKGISRFIRYPRPKGLTERCIRLHEESPHTDEYSQIKNQIIEYMVNEYIRNGNMICGEVVSVQDLGILLLVSSREIVKRLTKIQVDEQGTVTKDSISGGGLLELAAGELNRMLNQETDDRIHAENQLLRIEGLQRKSKKFNPLLYEQAAKAMNNLLTSSKNQADILKTILGVLTSNSFAQAYIQAHQGQTDNILTVDTALEILAQQNSNPLDRKFIESTMIASGATIEGKRLILPPSLPNINPLTSTKANSGTKVLAELKIAQNDIDNHLADREIQEATLV